MHFRVDYEPGPPDPAAVRAALSALGPVVERDGGWVYENLATRVTCRWALDAAGLHALLPVPRPSFFARETFPLFRAAAERLGLRCPPEPELWAAWRAVTAAALAGAPGRWPYCTPERTTYWWEYTRSRPALRLAWPSADVHIPDLYLFRCRETGEVVLVTIWPEEEGTVVLPEADYCILRRTRLPLPGIPGSRPAHTGLIPMARLQEALADAIEAYDQPVPHHLYRGGEGHPLRLRALGGLPGEPAGRYAPVRPDAVVDMRPEEG